MIKCLFSIHYNEKENYNIFKLNFRKVFVSFVLFNNVLKARFFINVVCDIIKLKNSVPDCLFKQDSNNVVKGYFYPRIP